MRLSSQWARGGESEREDREQQRPSTLASAQRHRAHRAPSDSSGSSISASAPSISGETAMPQLPRVTPSRSRIVTALHLLPCPPPRPHRPRRALSTNVHDIPGPSQTRDRFRRERTMVCVLPILDMTLPHVTAHVNAQIHGACATMRPAMLQKRARRAHARLQAGS